MKRIWKYKLDLPDCTIIMPNGAEVVYVGLQNGIPHLWVLVDPKALQDGRRFVVFGTGHDIPNGYLYIDTYQTPPYVWHVFEKVQSSTQTTKEGEE